MGQFSHSMMHGLHLFLSRRTIEHSGNFLSNLHTCIRCFLSVLCRQMENQSQPANTAQTQYKKYQSFRGIGIFYLCKVWEREGNPSYRSNLKKLNIRFNFVKLATKMNKFSAKKGRKSHIFLFIVPKMICCLRN